MKNVDEKDSILNDTDAKKVSDPISHEELANTSYQLFKQSMGFPETERGPTPNEVVTVKRMRADNSMSFSTNNNDDHVPLATAMVASGYSSIVFKGPKEKAEKAAAYVKNFGIKNVNVIDTGPETLELIGLGYK